MSAIGYKTGNDEENLQPVGVKEEQPVGISQTEALQQIGLQRVQKTFLIYASGNMFDAVLLDEMKTIRRAFFDPY